MPENINKGAIFMYFNRTNNADGNRGYPKKTKMPGNTLTQLEGNANSHDLPLHKIEDTTSQFSYQIPANQLNLGRLSDNRKNYSGPRNELPRKDMVFLFIMKTAD